MNDDTIQDLKQFIAVTVTQATSDMAKKEDVEKVSANITRVEDKLDNLSAAVADAIDTQSETTDERIENHEVRITKLESKTT